MNIFDELQKFGIKDWVILYQLSVKFPGHKLIFEQRVVLYILLSNNGFLYLGSAFVSPKIKIKSDLTKWEQNWSENYFQIISAVDMLKLILFLCVYARANLLQWIFS